MNAAILSALLQEIARCQIGAKPFFKPNAGFSHFRNQ